MSDDRLPELRVGPPWTIVGQERGRASGHLRLRRVDGVDLSVHLERCCAGRLRDAYPAGVHDVEVRFGGLPNARVLTDALAVVAVAVRSADPACRRVVYAVPRCSPDVARAAASADFRYVVDVDLVDDELSLLVAESDSVACLDVSRSRMPNT